ncbi:MAG: sulfatase [Verrucomicrobiales bacterium]|nr:sulfatase [Verrucomicrobiales bacterium]
MKKILLILLAVFPAVMTNAAELPNILWVTSEDNGPHLGCYGDEYAVSPNIDALASKSLLYTRASSNAPVCAPARTTVISGIYPPATGAPHMRSNAPLPAAVKMFPAYLRELGYYTTNKAKEDYNLEKSDDVWDESGGKAHWKNRAPGQPFFAVFNSTISHESKIRNEIADELRIHDPAKARVPAYHPDTPEVRKDWAQYYDRITEMDEEIGKWLKEVEDAGLSDNTIIIYWGDHGSGMPRNKRWPYNSGLHVPFLLHVPEKFKELAPDEYAEGGKSDRMIGFVDLAPTMLSLVGIEPKAFMQGHAFAGKHEVEGGDYSYGFRGRMDERYDLVRTVLGKRYVYLRHYMPHRIYGQYIDYMFQTPTTQVWHQMYHDGELNEAQSHFWEKKPTEELYDLETDPDEVNNLAGSPEHQEVLGKMRDAHIAWEREIRDLSFLPEAEIHKRSKGSTPYEMGQDPEQYDFETAFRTAQLATSQKAEDLPEIIQLLDSEDLSARYWGATGLLIQERAGVEAGYDSLLATLEDECPSVAIVAAEGVIRFGREEDREKALDVLMSFANQREGNVHEAILAVNALDYADDLAVSRLAEIKALPETPGKDAPRINGYVRNLLKKILMDFEG